MNVARTQRAKFPSDGSDSGRFHGAGEWRGINLALKYTHGYGVVAVPVNEIDSRGDAVLWAHDIPIVAKKDLAVAHGEIYYGELTNDRLYVKRKSTFRKARLTPRRSTLGLCQARDGGPRVGTLEVGSAQRSSVRASPTIVI